METKIIFLDHDGVMVTDNDYAMSRNNRFDVEPFSKGCVAALNEVIALTGAEIIVSSDWRNNLTFDAIRKVYMMNGVCKIPLGFTGNSPKYRGDMLEEGRSDEILEWVKLHRVRHWVAIDDMNMTPWLGEHFVHCKKFNEGLRQNGLKQKVIESLQVVDPWDEIPRSQIGL